MKEKRSAPTVLTLGFLAVSVLGVACKSVILNCTITPDSTSAVGSVQLEYPRYGPTARIVKVLLFISLLVELCTIVKKSTMLCEYPAAMLVLKVKVTLLLAVIVSVMLTAFALASLMVIVTASTWDLIADPDIAMLEPVVTVIAL